ncbi:uncharacterized protein LOC120674564 [Panicum virgatum]|nr:uncharacterized protein LOC120674564 [Panicum virgatum]
MAARAAAAAAAAACDAVRGALCAAALRVRSCRRSISAASSPGALAAGLAALLCCGAAAAAFPRAAASLLPLAATTALCCAAAGLFAAEEQRGAVEAVVLVGGRRQRGKPEAGLVQVIGEANASAYAASGGGVQVGCFLRRSAWRGVDEDGEEVVFAGTLAPCLAGGVPRLGHGALEEEVAAMRVDRLAEGVWNSYFGGWSRWHDIDNAAV